jgi:hypothetical protein
MTAKRAHTWSAQLTVVGLRFRWKKDGRDVLKRACPFPVELEREPDNKYDEDAIKVNVAGDFKLTKLRGQQLGYLANRKDAHTGERVGIASMLAPKIDAGTIEPVKLWVTDIDVEEGEATLEARFADIEPKRGTKRKKPAAKRKQTKKRVEKKKPLDNEGPYQ